MDQQHVEEEQSLFLPFFAQDQSNQSNFYDYSENDPLPGINSSFQIQSIISQDQDQTNINCNHPSSQSYQKPTTPTLNPNQKQIPSHDLTTKITRQGNTIVSNSTRQLINSIKQILKGKRQILQDINNWIIECKIKSQIWAIDAMCFKFLHLRDQEKLLSTEEYIAILNSFSTKLQHKLQNCKGQSSINKIETYQLHIDQYLTPDFSFQTIDSIFEDANKFFLGLVIKRKNTVRKSINQLKINFSKLKGNESLSYRQYGPPCLTSPVKKTSKRRPYRKNNKKQQDPFKSISSNQLFQN